MIIYGWGRQTRRSDGAVITLRCDNCGQQRPYYFLRVITWYTLFFIPVIPYRIRHFLLCQVCDRGAQLNGAGRRATAAVRDAARSLARGDTTGIDYRQTVIASGLLGPDGRIAPAYVLAPGQERMPRLIAWALGAGVGLVVSGGLVSVLPSGLSGERAFRLAHPGLTILVLYAAWVALALAAMIAGALAGDVVYRRRAPR